MTWPNGFVATHFAQLGQQIGQNPPPISWEGHCYLGWPFLFIKSGETVYPLPPRQTGPDLLVVVPLVTPLGKQVEGRFIRILVSSVSCYQGLPDLNNDTNGIIPPHIRGALRKIPPVGVIVPLGAGDGGRGLHNHIKR